MLRSELLRAVPGIAHGFSTRAGGVSEGPYATLNAGHAVGDSPARVEENLRRVAAEAGVDRIFTVRQVHGSRVVVLDGRPEHLTSPRDEADSLATGLAGVAVAVRTADCVPILLAEREGRAVAAVHAGWRGVVAGVIGAAVQVLHDRFGAPPSHLIAAIGPAIGPCCFEIGEDVAGRIGSAAPGTITQLDRGFRADLASACRALLAKAGLPPAHVDHVGGCTSCDERRFFSHRREGGLTGRHVSYIVRK